MRPVRNRYHCASGADGVALDHPPRTAPDAARHQPGHPGGAYRLRAGGGHCVSTRPKVRASTTNRRRSTRAARPRAAPPRPLCPGAGDPAGDRAFTARPRATAATERHPLDPVGQPTHREERAREQEQREDDDPHDDGERGIAVLGDAQADSGAPIAARRARCRDRGTRPHRLDSTEHRRDHEEDRRFHRGPHAGPRELPAVHVGRLEGRRHRGGRCPST